MNLTFFYEILLKNVKSVMLKVKENRRSKKRHDTKVAN
jgi:hypothetical protein